MDGAALGGGAGGGAALPAQPGDAVMTDAQPEPHQQQQAGGMGGMENISATLSHGGRFIQYNIFGNIFEVTAKYKPPIMPIGKGAYGIVWYFSLLDFFDFLFVFVFLNRNFVFVARL